MLYVGTIMMLSVYLVQESPVGPVSHRNIYTFGVMVFGLISLIIIDFTFRISIQKKLWNNNYNFNFNSRVLRNEMVIEIPNSDIVVGDVILLEKGDIVGADALIFEVTDPVYINNLHFNQTDEIIEKSEKKTSNEEILSENVILKAQFLIEGKCKALVVNTGDKTYYGL